MGHKWFLAMYKSQHEQLVILICCAHSNENGLGLLHGAKAEVCTFGASESAKLQQATQLLPKVAKFVHILPFAKSLYLCILLLSPFTPPPIFFPFYTLANGRFINNENHHRLSHVNINRVEEFIDTVDEVFNVSSMNPPSPFH